jgi:hypothetical protein
MPSRPGRSRPRASPSTCARVKAAASGERPGEYGDSAWVAVRVAGVASGPPVRGGAAVGIRRAGVDLRLLGGAGVPAVHRHRGRRLVGPGHRVRRRRCDDVAQPGPALLRRRPGRRAVPGQSDRRQPRRPAAGLPAHRRRQRTWTAATAGTRSNNTPAVPAATAPFPASPRKSNPPLCVDDVSQVTVLGARTVVMGRASAGSALTLLPAHAGLPVTLLEKKGRFRIPPRPAHISLVEQGPRTPAPCSASQIASLTLFRPALDTAEPKADHHTIELNHPHAHSPASSCPPHQH